MKKIVLSLLFLLPVAMTATEQNVVAVYPQSGDAVLFAFSTKPVLSYTATDLVMTTDNGSVQYPLNSLRKVAFEKADIPADADDMELPQIFSFRDGQIIIEGGVPGSPVNIYTVQGHLAAQHRLDSNGNGTISTSGYRGTAYILTTGKITLKFMQP
ncbi:MAG: hypothetical protein IJ776_00390 [Paludibacteraceae bacterium]|nr:hypothetical protein [Paludibacteraceae bacterium]